MKDWTVDPLGYAQEVIERLVRIGSYWDVTEDYILEHIKEEHELSESELTYILNHLEDITDRTVQILQEDYYLRAVKKAVEDVLAEEFP